jgi:hypothetical protein
MGDKALHAMIACDPRGKLFDRERKFNEDCYRTHYLIYPGARLERVDL